jgi:hypothetical protein
VRHAGSPGWGSEVVGARGARPFGLKCGEKILGPGGSRIAFILLLVGVFHKSLSVFIRVPFYPQISQISQITPSTEI